MCALHWCQSKHISQSPNWSTACTTKDNLHSLILYISCLSHRDADNIKIEAHIRWLREPEGCKRDSSLWSILVATIIVNAARPRLHLIFLSTWYLYDKLPSYVTSRYLWTCPECSVDNPYRTLNIEPSYLNSHWRKTFQWPITACSVW